MSDVARARTTDLARLTLHLIESDPSGILIDVPERELSIQEAEHAHRTIVVLHDVLRHTESPAIVAEIIFEIGSALAYPLGDSVVSLEAMRTAAERGPEHLHLATALRTAAMRAADPDAIRDALDREAHLSPNPTYRAAVLAAKARFLELHGEEELAIQTYEQAVDADPRRLDALHSLERLTTNPKQIAIWARRLADVTRKPKLRAEHEVRAAANMAIGDLEEAYALASRARETVPDSPSAELLYEELALRAGAYEDVIALRRDQIRRGSVDAGSANFDIGVMARFCLTEPDAELARHAFEEAAGAESPQTRRDSLQQLAFMYAAQNDAKRYAETLQRMLPDQRPRDRALTWTKIAVRRAASGDLDGAAQAYDRALTDDSRCRPAVMQAAELFARRGETTRLREALELWIGCTSDNLEQARAKAQLGALLIDDPATRELGITHLRDAVDAIPDHPIAFMTLESVYRMNGRFAELRDLYDEMIGRIEDESHRVYLLTHSGAISASLGDADQAFASLERAASLSAPTPPEAAVRLVQLAEQRGDPEQLAKSLERLATASQPYLAAASYARASQIHLHRGAHDDAIAAIRAALDVAPDGALQHLYPIALDLMRADDDDDAVLDLCDRAEASTSGAQRSAWSILAAEILAGRGSSGAAIDRLRSALVFDPSNVIAQQRLLELLLASDRWPEVMSTLDDVRGTTLFQAMVAERQGDDALALNLYEQALREGSSAAALPLGRALLKLQRVERLHAFYAGTASKRRALFHDRFRAGFFAMKSGDMASATRHFATAAELEPHSLPVALMQAEVAVGEAAPRVIKRLEKLLEECPAQTYWRRRRADALEVLGHYEDALSARRKTIGDLDPFVVSQVEIGMEERQDRAGLADLLGRIVDSPNTEATVRRAAAVKLGQVLEEIGDPRGAADAYGTAVAGAHPQAALPARIALPRIYQGLGDTPAHQMALKNLLEAIRSPVARAACSRRLAVALEAQHQPDAALVHYEESLAAHPRDYGSLMAFARLAPGERLRPYLRAALDLEEEPSCVARIATQLAAQLLRPMANEDEVEEAIMLADRVLTHDDGHLEARMLRAEGLVRLGEDIDEALSIFTSIANDETVDAPTRIDAFRRLIERASPESVKELATQVEAIETDDFDALSQKLAIYERVGDADRALALLPTLVEACEDPAHKADLREKLAGLRQRVSATEITESTSPLHHVLEKMLNEGRWDQAQAAFDRRFATLDNASEIKIRRRLAELFERSLNRPDRAVEQYRRILEKGEDATSLDRLAALEDDHERAVGYLRRMLDSFPDRVQGYRALRHRFLALGNEDGAFCCEAVLSGLGVADDEETYFYRRRRSRVTSGFSSSLSDVDLAAFTTPASRLVAALDATLVGEAAGDAVNRATAEIAREVARLFNQEPVEALAVAPEVGPAATPQHVLVPRDLVTAERREQQFVFGALFSRLFFGGVAVDPSRPQRDSEAALSTAIAALIKWAGGTPDGEVNEETLSRLAKLPAPAQENAARAFASLGTASVTAIRDQVLSNAARAAILCSQDPAIAIGCLRFYGSMFAWDDARPAHGLSGPALAALPFVVSEGHLSARARLQVFV